MIETFDIPAPEIERMIRQRVRFNAGRDRINAKRIARLATATAAIRMAYDRDLIENHPARGRATRIARNLRMKRPTVVRILSNLLKCPH